MYSITGKKMSKGKKRQVCVRIEESIVEEMEKVRDRTGVSVSTQIELRLKGFTITSAPEKGNPEEILAFFSTLGKDDELANNVDEAVEQVRKELKLR
jgi:hypothetical protein